jgi:hypothetical protein
MNRPAQATLDEAHRWADRYIEGRREILGKDGGAKHSAESLAQTAAIMYERPGLADWVEESIPMALSTDAWGADKIIHNMLCEFAALALERGELPPKALCQFAAGIMRQGIKKPRRSFSVRDNTIISMLFQMRKQWGISPLKNRSPTRGGQKCGCDIVIEAFRKAGVSITPMAVEGAWRQARWAKNVRT